MNASQRRVAALTGIVGAAPKDELSPFCEFDVSPRPRPSTARPTSLLVFTSLYPNAAQPRHGVFIEERLRELIATGRIAATVVAPVPWFPFKGRRFGGYATYADVPRLEERHGVRVLHPRYPVIPKVGMNLAPALMYHAVLPVVRRLFDGGQGYDMLDAHYLYPDGVAAAAMARKLAVPVVLTARGSDVNVLPRYPMPRARILGAVRSADAVVTVSEALRSRLIALGVPPDHITALRNGVDLERFRPVDAGALRARLGATGPVWLAVGHLIEIKGTHLAIAALADVPDAMLVVAGQGPERQRLQDLAERLGVARRVQFVGAVPHDELPTWYSAADALIHASAREGMPNVVLESLACGTPVVAAPFESATELIRGPEAGEVAEARSAPAILAAWRRLHARGPGRTATRAFGERLGWGPVVDAQCDLYARVVASSRSAYSLTQGAHS